MAGAEIVALIGIGASVIQLVEGCDRVLGRIHQFRQNMAFHDIELQLPLLMKDLERLSLPEYLQSIDGSTEKALIRVLEGCRRQINLLDELIQRLTPAATASKFQRTWKGMKSLGKDTKLREILGILSEYKATITLHLSSRQANAFAKVSVPNPAQKSYFEISAQKVSHFVGRKPFLDEIKSSIASAEAYPAIIALTGPGGQGKTQLALEFCHKSSSDFHAIFWIDASSRESAMRSFENVATKMSPSGQGFSDPASKLDFVKDALRNWQERWLLVFDNYDEPRAFHDVACFFPTSGRQTKNAIIITSRHALSERLGIAVKLGGLPEYEALELLLARCSRGKETGEDNEYGKEIVKRLGYLPLAIDQAAAYISIRQISFQMFLKHYEKRKEVILRHTPMSAVWEYRLRGSDATNNPELNLSVLTTWELSFEQIGNDEQERESIGKFLTQSAFFDPTSINEGLFRTYFESSEGFKNIVTPWMSLFSTGETWDSFLFQDTVVGLTNLSLIQSVEISSQETRFSLHPLIKDWLQLRNSNDQCCHYTSMAISMCHCLLQEQDVEAIPLQIRQECLGHVDTCIENYSRFMGSNEDKGKYGGLVEGWQTTFATFYGRHDRYVDAEKLFLESLAWQKQELGEMNLSTLRTMNNMAAMYLDVRELGKAEALLLKTLAIKESLLGPDNTVTLNTVNNLGNLYAMQSLFDKASEMYTRTLEGYQRIYGRDHKTVIEAENNLGEVAMKMGRFEEAKERFDTALSRLSAAKDTGLSLYIKSNIAIIHQLQRRHQEAVELYLQVIKGREMLHGPDHSSTLSSMCELGDVYRTAGQPEAAEEWYTRGKADNDRQRYGLMKEKSFEETEHYTKAECFSMSDEGDLIFAARCDMGSNLERLKIDDPPWPALVTSRSGRRRQNELAQQGYRKRIRERKELESLERSLDASAHAVPPSLPDPIFRAGIPNTCPSTLSAPDKVGSARRDSRA